jgi:hypothetical protein
MWVETVRHVLNRSVAELTGFRCDWSGGCRPPLCWERPFRSNPVISVNHVTRNGQRCREAAFHGVPRRYDGVDFRLSRSRHSPSSATRCIEFGGQLRPEVPPVKPPHPGELRLDQHAFTMSRAPSDGHQDRSVTRLVTCPCAIPPCRTLRSDLPRWVGNNCLGFSCVF